ncbi:MAG: hypothetical protein Q9227_009554 [Pyrenula ochraceoflavens]
MVSSWCGLHYSKARTALITVAGAPKYREMRRNGETPLPPAVHLESAESLEIPSREAGRTIPCRVLRPDHGKPISGVFYHIHGGGWVLMDEKSQDPYLKKLADECGLACVSVGYRLAPEHPFPAGPNDSYDLSFQPSSLNFDKDPTLVLDLDLMKAYNKAYLPGKSDEERKSPKISPLFADLYRLKLPSAFFTCGTEDMLLDDTVFMGVKWQMAGGEAVVKIYPGGPHGFIMFPPESMQCAKDGMDDTLAYIQSKLR